MFMAGGEPICHAVLLHLARHRRADAFAQLRVPALRKRGADGERRCVLVQRLVLRRGVKILTDARRQVAHDVVYILSAAEAQATMLVQRRHAQKAQARGAVGKVDVRNALVGEFVRRAPTAPGV